MPTYIPEFPNANIGHLRKHKEALRKGLRGLYSRLISCRIRDPQDSSQFARICMDAVNPATGQGWRQEVVLFKSGMAAVRAFQPLASWHYRTSYFRKTMRIVMSWFVQIVREAQEDYDMGLASMEAVD